MYSVKGFKEHRGTEGYGYNATLYRDGKKIAFVIDEGNGGEVIFEWNDRLAPRVEIHSHGYQDEPITYQGTPEEKLLVELADSQTYTFDGHTGRKDGAILMGDFIRRYQLRNKTEFSLRSDGEGRVRVVNAPAHAGAVATSVEPVVERGRE